MRTSHHAEHEPADVRTVRDDGARTPISLLEPIARAIGDVLGWGTVAVSLYRPAWDDLEVALVHGDAAARTALLGRTASREQWEQLLDPAYRRRGVFWLPAGSAAEACGVPSLGSDHGAPDDAGRRHPEDRLLAPLAGAGGELLGVVSVAAPPSGCPPAEAQLDALAVLAASAARALEAAESAAVAERHRAALELLLGVSSQLTSARSADVILQAVCDAIRDALGFGLVVVELADREADRYLPRAAAGLELERHQLQLDVPVARLDALFDPAFEVEGCYLLPREEALTRVGDSPPTFASTRNGRGPRAWNHHWLVVPLSNAHGERLGFIWADDPEDRLLPDRGALQALRLFADQAVTALVSAGQYEQLRRANAYRTALIERSPVGICVLGPDGRVRALNQAGERIFGWTAEEVIGSEPPWIPPSEREAFRANVARTLAGRSLVEAEFADLRRDGSEVVVRISTAALHGPDGEPEALVATVYDVTDRVRAAEELARKHAELEALHETTLELIERRDPTSALHEIVARATALLGTEHGDVYLVDQKGDVLELAVGAGLFERLKGVRMERGEGLAGRVWEEGRPIAVDDYSAWGGSHPAFRDMPLSGSAAVPLRAHGEILGVLAVTDTKPGRRFGEAELALLNRFGQLASIVLQNARLHERAQCELEERREAEEALRRSRELYRAIVDHSTDMLALIGRDGRILFASPAHASVLGYSPDELVGRSPVELVHPHHAGAVARYLETALRGEPAEAGFFRIRHRDGSRVLVEGVAAPIRGRDGEVQMVLSVARDVSERHRAERELRRAKEYSERLIQSANALIVGLDPQGTIELVNEEVERVTGYAAEELVGRDWFDVLTPRERFPEVWRVFSEWAQGGEFIPTYEGPILTREGEVRTISWRNRQLFEHGRLSGSISFGIDLTERRALEEQLRHAQKLEAVGRLAGGVAHDFNNLLTAIGGYAELALAGLDASAPARRQLKQISGAADRAAALTRQLLAFSRRQVLEPEVVDLNLAVEQLGELLARLLGEDVELQIELAPDGAWARVDPGQLEQMVLNLAVNARDAMPDGGTLTVRTALVSLDGDAAAAAGVAPGEYAALTVSDTGHGMDEATLARAFEPFFTTKPAGRGTGLGLATVYGIVTQTGGGVHAASQPGRGTSLTAYLPAEAPGQAVEEQPPADQPEQVGGGETILLAEDEDVVRSLVAEMLTDAGYQVLSAADGHEAARLAEAYAGHVDALVTDVVMPGLNGPELAARVRRSRPGTAVLFVSGYAEQTLAEPDLAQPGTAFLQKPFRIPQLAEALRELLDASAAVAGNGRPRP